MAYLFIRGIGPKLRREIERRARTHGCSMADEVQSLLRDGLSRSEERAKLSMNVRTGRVKRIPRPRMIERAAGVAKTLV